MTPLREGSLGLPGRAQLMAYPVFSACPGPSSQPFRDFHSLALVQTSFRGFGLFRDQVDCSLSLTHAAVVLRTIMLVPILQTSYLEAER